ncbi:hypothetical protein [Nocardiopsis sp. JB363]|uniref:hypothetical protein n=1 Tax=Nocardiopsis sp. JB363 TaxID=1434837 RepID=UPI00097A6FBE|nr:hypothetical protein [Nocardiopsis sp. JB363]SIO84646.1 hypothetical protein BQ8420_02960 [Nocardiopsis sp. JB363]
MYEDEPTFDALAAIEDMEMMRAHSPTFWDTDAAEIVHGHDPDDPWNHPSVDVEAALADGWDDPAEAIEVRELLADDVRLTGLADTPYGRPTVRLVDELFVDEPTGEELFHDLGLDLVPVTVDGSWPAHTASAAA